MLQTIKQQIKRRTARTTAIALALFESVLLTGAMFAGTAHAAYTDCNYSAGDHQIVCFWKDANFTNLRLDYYSPGRYVCHNITSSFNDQISSLYNKTDSVLHFYKDINCSGGNDFVAPQTTRATLASTFNDAISSFRLENPL